MLLTNYFLKDIHNLSNNYFQLFEDFQLDTDSFPKTKSFYKKDKFYVEIEVPGLEKKDIEISISRNYLSVNGKFESKNKKEKQDTTETLLRKERYYGSFNRNIQLPEEVDVENSQANLKNGLLSVEFSIKKNQRYKKIEIK